MLEATLTRHHAGLTLWGDYTSLERLHTFIHHAVEESPTIEDKEGFVLGLAYDVRKALQGCRSQNERIYPNDDRCCLYGVEILWPILLIQIGVLRHAMAFFTASKLDQAVMYELEHVVECAARAAIPVTADEVLQRVRRIGSTPYAHLDRVLDSRCRYFIALPDTERLKVLPKLLDTLDPMYRLLTTEGAQVRSDVISPGVFVDDASDWPDFKW